MASQEASMGSMGVPGDLWGASRGLSGVSEVSGSSSGLQECFKEYQGVPAGLRNVLG